MIRYSKVTTGQPREILLLKGRGCRYKQCTFCDYYADGSDDEEECAAVNAPALARVTGRFGVLEVICSGSFTDMYSGTIAAVREVCVERGIKLLIVESHWFYREFFAEFRALMAPIAVEFKAGIETFDVALREELKKGLGDTTPEELAEYFRQCNLLVGIVGQTVQSVERDIRTALEHFRRVCVNVFCENSTPVKVDAALIAELYDKVLPQFEHDARVDILFENTDFGVGTEDEAE